MAQVTLSGQSHSMSQSRSGHHLELSESPAVLILALDVFPAETFQEADALDGRRMRWVC